MNWNMNRRLVLVGAVVSSAGLLSMGLLTLSRPAYAISSLAIGAPAPDFTAQGADGAQHRLSEYRGSTVVLEWTSPICEFTARQYNSGNMQALQNLAAQHKVVWLTIDTAAPGKPDYLTADAAAQVTKQRGAKITSFLLDPRGTIGQLYGAKSTPSVYIINASGALVYQGAVSAPDGDPRTARNYVKEALEEMFAGKPVSTATTQQYGCPIAY